MRTLDKVCVAFRNTPLLTDAFHETFDFQTSINSYQIKLGIIIIFVCVVCAKP